MYINNINPVLLSIGPFSIRYYGIIYVIGFIITYYYLKYLIKKKDLELSNAELENYMIWIIIGIVMGARAYEVLIYNAPYYFQNPSEIFKIWNGGLSFHGGLIGLVIATILFYKKYKKQLYPRNVHIYDILDALTIPATIALFLGRIANYTNSELYGTITNSVKTPWCVVFQKVDNYCRHPTQLYEAIKNILIFCVLIFYKSKNYPKNSNSKNSSKYSKGTLFWLFIKIGRAHV